MQRAVIALCRCTICRVTKNTYTHICNSRAVKMINLFLIFSKEDYLTSVMALSLQLTGSLMVATCVEVFLGATGIIGMFMSHVGPLTVTAYLCTLIVALTGIFADVAQASWGITLL